MHCTCGVSYVIVTVGAEPPSLDTLNVNFMVVNDVYCIARVVLSFQCFEKSFPVVPKVRGSIGCLNKSSGGLIQVCFTK